jgi:hypothetical protein
MHTAGRLGVAIDPPSNIALSHMTAAWLGRDQKVESVNSFALASVLPSIAGEPWKPRLSEVDHAALRAYLVEDSADELPGDRWAPVAAALIGFHAGDVFSRQELSKLLSGPRPILGDDKRVPSLLMRMGLDPSDLKRAPNVGATRKGI